MKINQLLLLLLFVLFLLYLKFALFESFSRFITVFIKLVLLFELPGPGLYIPRRTGQHDAIIKLKKSLQMHCYIHFASSQLNLSWEILLKYVQNLI